MAVDLEKVRWAVEALRWAKDRKAEIKDVEDKARDALEQTLGDDTVGTLDGHEAVTWKFFKRNALDQKMLKSAYPEIYESCKRVTEVRRFALTEE